MRQHHALKQKFYKQPKISLVTRIMVLSLVLSIGFTSVVQAVSYQQQIDTLKNQNNILTGQRNSLQSQANDLQSTIDGLQAEINSMQARINENESRRQGIEAQIKDLQTQIDQQKKLLGENIRAQYLEDDMSTFEILASSNNLSKFVDREQYRISVKDKITSTMDKIKSLQDELDKQRAEVEKILADQRGIQSQLGQQKAEQDRLMNLNAADRAALDGQIRANSSQLTQLRAAQAAENMRLFGGSVRNVPDSTGYPWANAPFPNVLPDSWGMYQRQCVSYTAWKVYKSGRFMPYWGGHGNANQWDDNARAAGIPVDGNPRAGDVAVSNKGTYGHVMYVEHVYGDGTIYVSQYNAGWDGRYSEARVSAAGLSFIHF